MGRWDWLEGVRAQSPAEVLVGEMAKVLADALDAWPPPLELTDDAAGQRFAPLYAPGAPRPHVDVMRQGLRLAQLDLAREHEAIDRELRGGEAARACADAMDRLAMELVWRLASEWMLELRERTGGRLSRAMLGACLARASARLAALRDPG